MRCLKTLGLILAGVGVTIILALILPTGFLWFLFGLGLLAGGLILLLKR